MLKIIMEQRSTNPALIEAERVLDHITVSYFEGLSITEGKADATKYMRSRMLYAQTVSDEFSTQVIARSLMALRESERGNWRPMANEIRDIAESFGQTTDKECIRIGHSLSHLALYISP